METLVLLSPARRHPVLIVPCGMETKQTRRDTVSAKSINCTLRNGN